MIRVQVGSKRYGQVRRFQRHYSLIEHCCLGPPYYTGAKINQVGAAVHNNRGSWARPVRIREWVPGPKQNNLCLARWYWGRLLLSGKGRGDLFATVQVLTPKKLTREQRHLVEQLAKALPKEAFEPRPREDQPDERNLFDRVKDMFG